MNTTKTKHIMIAVILGLFVSSVSATELGFRISDDTIGAGIEGDITGTELLAGFEHFYKDKDDAINISSLTLHTKGQTAISNLPTTVMLGLEASYMKEGEFKGSAIAFGGNVRINIPSAPGFSTEARLHYAPNIVAYGDSDRYAHARLQANYRVIQNADISAGYQYFNSGIENGDDRTFESGLFVGLRLTF